MNGSENKVFVFDRKKWSKWFQVINKWWKISLGEWMLGMGKDGEILRHASVDIRLVDSMWFVVRKEFSKETKKKLYIRDVGAASVIYFVFVICILL